MEPPSERSLVTQRGLVLSQVIAAPVVRYRGGVVWVRFPQLKEVKIRGKNPHR